MFFPSRRYEICVVLCPGIWDSRRQSDFPICSAPIPNAGSLRERGGIGQHIVFQKKLRPSQFTSNSIFKASLLYFLWYESAKPEKYLNRL